jgi:hypothetical protein
MRRGFGSSSLYPGFVFQEVVAMTSDGTGNGGRQDQAWPGAVRWELGEARGQIGDVLWQCEALRAGQLYQRSLFATREEAETFARQLQVMEPDQMLSVAAIKASTVWN